MEKNIFLTYKTSLITKQRQILFAVVVLFLISQLANLFNYNNVENLLIFIVFGLMTFGHALAGHVYGRFFVGHY